MKKDFTGYILAGGKSSRMGRDKAFLKIGEKNFLENAAEILAPVCEQVEIILNKSQTDFTEKLPAEISYIFDIYENRGALGGIHAALKNCKTELAVILAVDLPFVLTETIKKMCETAIAFDKFSAFVPRQNDGRLQPLCAIYRAKSCLNEIENFLKYEKSASVKGFLGKIPIKIIEQKSLTDQKNVFLNVNSSKEFAEII